MMERNTVVAIAAALCIAPSAVCNVLPHVQAITDASGHINSASTGMATMQAVSVMAMAGMPFAVEKFNAVGLKFGGYLLGLVLLCINFTNALDVADAVRKSSTSEARIKIEKAKALRADIAQYKFDKAAIPAHDIVTAGSVSVARTPSARRRLRATSRAAGAPTRPARRKRPRLKPPTPRLRRSREIAT